jgi:hypothetical protein
VIAMMMQRAYDTDETVTDDSDSDSDSFGVELPVDVSARVKMGTGSSTNSFETQTPPSVRAQRFNRVKVEPSSAYEKTIPVTKEPPTSVVHVKIEPPSDDDDDDEPRPSFGATPYHDAHMQMFAQLPLLSMHEQMHGLDTLQRFHDLFKQNESLKRKLAMYKVINKKLKRRSVIGMVTRSRSKK